ncbi:MAG: 30S ribosomal protein S20 [Candidatus Krumholzibacteriia bacterium]
MPHHKSSKKRLLTSKKRNLRNRQNRATMRSALKKFRTEAAGASPEQKLAELPALYSLVDVQARKGIIPKQRASRLKSRLAALAAKGQG